MVFCPSLPLDFRGFLFDPVSLNERDGEDELAPSDTIMAFYTLPAKLISYDMRKGDENLTLEVNPKKVL